MGGEGREGLLQFLVVGVLLGTETVEGMVEAVGGFDGEKGGECFDAGDSVFNGYGKLVRAFE